MAISEELKFINAMIGFCRPSGGTWPAPFEEHEYVVTGVEMGVQVIVNGDIRTPTPELILSSSSVSHAMLLEAKTTTVSTKQARAYKNIGASSLVSQGLAAPNTTEDTLRVDVIYMCSGENFDKLSDDMARSNCDFPIVSHTDSKFVLGCGHIKCEPVHSEFDTGIKISEEAWPTHFVRCDRNSSAGHLASFVMSEVVRQLLLDDFVGVDAVCTSAIDFWDRRGPDDKKRLSRNVYEILSEASHTELSEYLKRDDRNTRNFLSPRPLTSKSLDRLSDITGEFVQRLQEGRPYRLDQPPLFPFLDQT